MFQPIEENVSVYKKVVAQIQEMILHGELKKGDRLPPERQLAEMLGVGRPALKQAISALEVLGIIRSRQGDGNYITADTVEVIKNRNSKEAAYYMAELFQNKFPNYQYYMDVHAL